MKNLELDHITLGVAYYPEHWERSLWREDLRRMKKMGIEVIRIAEFAWNRIEPREGEFDYSFFDSFMDLTLEEGIKVIFCTPTATPPVWMSHMYPEILNADLDGNKIYPGMRQQFTPNSEKYRWFTERFVERVAEHYSKYPNIVAWQLDNEIHCRQSVMFRSESDQIAFRRYLKNAFGTVENLNRAMGGEFWNQSYTDWNEVYLPRRTPYGGQSNPHMMLFEKRFVSDTIYEFCKLQADIIRKYSAAPITTNGMFSFIDYHRLTDHLLDFITYDNYPNFANQRVGGRDVGGKNRDLKHTGRLTYTRSVSPVFGIMEQQSGPGGWNDKMNQAEPKPGWIRLWTLQSIAQGADYISYFRWRTCTFGTEMYWHGILNYDNRDNRRVAEIQRTYSDIQRIQGVCGKRFLAQAALLRDYDNEWDGFEDRWHGDLDQESYAAWLRGFENEHVPHDIIYINDDTTVESLMPYKLLVYPHPSILTEKRIAVLKAYVEAGGKLIFGCRTGYKTIDGQCTMMPLPGYAADLCGAEVKEFTCITPADGEQRIRLNNGESLSAPLFHDILKITDGTEIGVFEGNFYKGSCAVSMKKVGKGSVCYFGSIFTADTARSLLRLLEIQSPIKEFHGLPEQVQLSIRGDYIFLLNFGEDRVLIECEGSWHDYLHDADVRREIYIDAWDAVVLRKNSEA